MTPADILATIARVVDGLDEYADAPDKIARALGFHARGWEDVATGLRALSGDPLCHIGPTLTECSVCRRQRPPTGRDAPAAAGPYCEHKCPGRYAEPRPSSLWPGEVYRDERAS